MIKKPSPKGALIPKLNLNEFMSRAKDADLNSYFIFGAIILVLLVGIYALFAPGVESQKAGNPACGKIVIAADGPSLRNNVAPTLESAKYFLVVDPLSAKLDEAIQNPYRSTQPDLQIVYLIAGKGEEAVVVGNIDSQSYKILMQFGIRVFGGYTGQAKKVIRLYKQARITPTPLQNATPPAMTAPAAIGSVPNAPVAFFPQGQPAQSVGRPCQFVCPNCRYSAAGQDFGGPCPLCPNCRGQMTRQNAGQGAGWGVPDVNGMGQIYPNGNPMLPGGMNAGWGAMNMMNGPCPLPGRGGWMQGAMIQNLPDADTMRKSNPGTQVGFFGWGQQAFVCPNCNWRMKASRQGNSFPDCPNCGAPMALDMADKNKAGAPWGGEQAANLNQMPPQYNSAMNSSNYAAAQNGAGIFQCPNCNWRMYGQSGQGAYPRCPNCGQIMAQGGGNNQPNYYNQGNVAMAPAAAQMPIAAPAIASNAVMTHEYRGVCSNCHQIIGPTANSQNMQPPAGNSLRVGIGRRAR
ncbi:MAG: magnetochrome domain-containing protein [Candidatus Omnitrophica bacterium]|nr:magnetochrome domain-containing protein [Candidatus Omnitrophota bacterium]